MHEKNRSEMLPSKRRKLSNISLTFILQGGRDVLPLLIFIALGWDTPVYTESKEKDEIKLKACCQIIAKAINS
jgi:hypothetical protein